MDRPTHATLETDSDGFTRREFLSAMLSTSLLAQLPRFSGQGPLFSMT